MTALLFSLAVALVGLVIEVLLLTSVNHLARWSYFYRWEPVSAFAVMGLALAAATYIGILYGGN